MTPTKKAAAKKATPTRAAKAATTKKAPPVKKAAAKKTAPLKKAAPVRGAVASVAPAAPGTVVVTPHLVAAPGLPAWPSDQPPPPAPPGVPATADRPTGRPRVILGLVAAIVVILVIVAVFGRGSGNSSPTTKISPDALKAFESCPAPTADPAAISNQLRDLLVAAPDGFVQQPDSEPPNGALTRASVAAPTPNPSLVEQTLLTRGMTAGYRRTWDNRVTGVELRVVVHRFSCVNGAGAQLDAMKNISDSGLATPTRMSVTNVPFATGVQAGAADKEGLYRQNVYARAGTAWIGVYSFSTKPLDPALVTSVLKQQYDRLT